MTIAKRIAASVAGPALVVVAVLAVLHRIAFSGGIPTANRDILGFWLPYHCYLGRALASGHIPAWNPFSMGGARFAADPQSGWMYLPAMALYATLPCRAATPTFIVAQPILAGLGTYWLLRGERVSRPAATVAACFLAVVISGTPIATELPFSGAIAWTMIMLAATARYWSATQWPRRLLWALGCALAWGQIAAAHMSHGLILGTSALIVYSAARGVAAVRSGEASLGAVAARGGALIVLLLPVNLAFFLPRLAYLPSTALGVGYAGLHALQHRLSGAPGGPIGVAPDVTLKPSWVLSLAVEPGGRFLDAALLLCFGGLFIRRRRPLAVAFVAFGTLSYLLSLGAVARALAPVVRNLPMGDFYIHNPWRLHFGILIAGAVLVGLGVQAWVEARSNKQRALMLVPGLAIWGVAGPAFDAYSRHAWLITLAAVVGAAILIAVARLPKLILVVPVVLAVALSADALAHPAEPGLPTPPATTAFAPGVPRAGAYFDAASFMRRNSLERAVPDGTGRLLSLDPTIYSAHEEFHALVWRRLQANRRALLFHHAEVQAYNPDPPLRYWEYVQSLNFARYNSSILTRPFPGAVSLFGVRWIVASTATPPDGSVMVHRSGPWALYRVSNPTQRASLVSSWRVAPSASSALSAVTAPAYDSARNTILESAPGIRKSAGPPGTATYRTISPQENSIRVSARRDSLLVVRDAFDTGWHATLDGHPVPILRADYLMQAVPVPAGRHTIVMSFVDPSIGYGLAGSASAIALVLALVLALAITRRTRTPQLTHR